MSWVWLLFWALYIKLFGWGFWALQCTYMYVHMLNVANCHGFGRVLSCTLLMTIGVRVGGAVSMNPSASHTKDFPPLPPAPLETSDPGDCKHMLGLCIIHISMAGVISYTLISIQDGFSWLVYSDLANCKWEVHYHSWLKNKGILHLEDS